VSSPRREKLERLLAEDPQDAFLRYSLGLELEAEGDWKAALTILESLGRGPVPYVPALHMAGRFLARRGEVGAARRALREGIEAARAQGQAHAAAEMAELLQSLWTAGSAPDE